MTQMVKSNLSQHSVAFGGLGSRSMLGGIVFILFMFMPIVVAALPYSNGAKILVALICITAIFSMFIFDWQSILPGTVVSRDDPSFLRRYAAEISGVGAITAIIGLVIPMLKRKASAAKVLASIEPENQEPAAGSDS